MNNKIIEVLDYSMPSVCISSHLVRKEKGYTWLWEVSSDWRSDAYHISGLTYAIMWSA